MTYITLIRHLNKFMMKKIQRRLKMAFFKTDEEKFIEYKNTILDEKEYIGLVGASNTGYTLSEGFTNTDKIRFKKTKFKIYDDRIMVERHRNFIYISDIKELFKEKDEEALIILNNDDIIPIAPVNTFKNEIIEFEAFINILTKLIEDNKSNDNDYKLNNNVNTEDKFDKLIKLGEMYDKGLLSDEEFDSLKQEILHDNTEESTVVPEEDIETSQNVCRNCGTEVEEDSKFCAECGNKLD